MKNGDDVWPSPLPSTPTSLSPVSDGPILVTSDEDDAFYSAAEKLINYARTNNFNFENPNHVVEVNPAMPIVGHGNSFFEAQMYREYQRQTYLRLQAQTPISPADSSPSSTSANAALQETPLPPRASPPAPSSTSKIVCQNCLTSKRNSSAMRNSQEDHPDEFCCRDAYVYSLPPWKRKSTKNLDPDGRILRETIADNTAMIRKFNELTVSNPNNIGFSTVHIRQALEYDQMHGRPNPNPYLYYNENSTKGYSGFPGSGSSGARDERGCAQCVDANSNSNPAWNDLNTSGGTASGGGSIWDSRSASAPCTPRQEKLGPSCSSPRRPATASSAVIPCDPDTRKSSEALQSIIEKKFNDVIASKKKKRQAEDEGFVADIQEEGPQGTSPSPREEVRQIQNQMSHQLHDANVPPYHNKEDLVLFHLLRNMTSNQGENVEKDERREREEQASRFSPPPGFGPKATQGRVENLMEMEALMQYAPRDDSKREMNFGNMMGVQYGNYGQSHHWPQQDTLNQHNQNQNDRMGDSNVHSDGNPGFQEEHRRHQQQQQQQQQQAAERDQQHQQSMSRNVFGPYSVYEESMNYFGVQRSYPPQHTPHEFGIGGRYRINQSPAGGAPFPPQHQINVPQQPHRNQTYRQTPQQLSRNHPYLPPQTLAVVPNYRAVVSPPPGQFYANDFGSMNNGTSNRPTTGNGGGGSSVSYPRGMWADVGRCNNNSVEVTQLIRNAVRVGLSAGAAAMNNAHGRHHTDVPGAQAQAYPALASRSAPQQGESAQQQNDPPVEVLHQRSLQPTGSSEALLEETKKQMHDIRRTNSTRPFTSAGCGRNEDGQRENRYSTPTSARYRQQGRKEESRIGSSSDSFIGVSTRRDPNGTGDSRNPPDQETTNDKSSSSGSKPNRTTSLVNVNLRPANLATPPCAAPKPKKPMGMGFSDNK